MVILVYQSEGIYYMKSKLNIEILMDENGDKANVLMSADEFNKLISELEDVQDLKSLYKLSRKKLKTIPYEEVRKEIFGNGAKK